MRETPAGSRADAAARAACLAAIALGLALRLALPFCVPFGDTVRFGLQGLNDEPAHFRYVMYVAEHRALPVQRHRFEEPGAFQRADFEFHQPPLYYVLGACLERLAGPGHALLACRLFSALCGIGTLALAWPLLGAALPASAALPALAFGTLWLTPSYFCALASNDALSWLVAAWIVTLLWRQPEGGSWGRALALGLGLGLGCLTKSTLAVFLPAAALDALRRATRARAVRPIAEGAVALLVAGLLVSPWVFRNQSLYGSPWGLELGGPAAPYRGGLPWWVALLANTNKYFWFPMQHVPDAGPARTLRALGGAWLAVHAIAALAVARRGPLPDPRRLTLVFVLGLVVLAYAARNALWFAPEARFLLPALLPLLWTLGAGAWGLAGVVGRPAFAALDLLVAALLPFAWLALA